MGRDHARNHLVRRGVFLGHLHQLQVSWLLGRVLARDWSDGGLELNLRGGVFR